jgi:hypothetical protein
MFKQIEIDFKCCIDPKIMKFVPEFQIRIFPSWQTLLSSCSWHLAWINGLLS